MTSQAPAPGWYPDPNGGPGEKYWDGQDWRADGSGRPGSVAPYGGAAQGVDPSGQPLSDKSKLVAGLLQIFLGGFGVGRFYLGYTNIGILANRGVHFHLRNRRRVAVCRRNHDPHGQGSGRGGTCASGLRNA